MKKGLFALCIRLMCLLLCLPSLYAQSVVESYNFTTGSIEKCSYEGVTTYESTGVILSLESGMQIEHSALLPVYIEEYGWMSYEHNREAFASGNTVYVFAENTLQRVRIRAARVLLEKKSYQTYVNVLDNHNYFYQGLLVHNEDSGGGEDSGSGGEDSGGGGEDSGGDTCCSGCGGPADSPCNGAGGGGGNKKGVAEAMADASAVRDQAVEAANAAFTAGEMSVAEYNQAISEAYTAHNTAGSPTVGDPVLVTSGTYALEETDIVLKSGLLDVEITRSYYSGLHGGNLFGSLWKTNLENRIMRGYTPITHEQLQTIEATLQPLEDLYTQAVNTSEGYSECDVYINEIRDLINTITQIYQQKQLEYQISLQLQMKNLYTAYGDVNLKTGNTSLVYADEKGSIILFTYTGGGLWKSDYTGDAHSIIIQSRDGGDSLTDAGFIVREKNGVTKYFDRWGLLERTVDRAGNATLYTHTNGKPTSIRGADNTELRITYGAGTISGIELYKDGKATGKQTRYFYSGNTLIACTDTDGDTSRYEYDGNGNLSRLVKSDGSFIQFVYGLERNGRAVTTSTINEERHAERFEYDFTNRITKHTDHDGTVGYYYYNENHKTVKEVHADGTTVEFAYDGAGRILSESRNGSPSSYGYDSRGNKTYAQYADGSRETWAYNEFDQITTYGDRDGYTTRRTYDNKGNCLAFYNGAQRVYSATYNAQGRMSESIAHDGTKTSYTYDKYGNLTNKTTSAKTAPISEGWTYDAQNRVSGFVDGEGRKWTYVHTAKTVTETSPAGLETVYTYNSRKDLIRIDETDTQKNERRKRDYLYDKRHLLIETRTNGITTAFYTYTPAGKTASELRTIRQNGAMLTGEQWKTAYLYDSVGRIREVQRSKLDKDGNTIQNAQNTIITEQYQYVLNYNGENRTILNGEGERTVIGYDRWKRTTSVQNALNETAARKLSAAGRVQQEESSHGGEYAYSYDAQGRLYRAGEAGKAAAAAEYNADGSTARTTDRLGITTEYMYDGRGNLLQTRSAEKTTAYEYDKAGRLTAVLYGTAATLTKENCERYTTYEYAPDERSITVSEGSLYVKTWKLNAWGETTEILDGTGNSQQYCFDEQGRIKETFDAYGNKTAYTYNALNKIETITYSDNTCIHYAYNQSAHVTQITDALGIQWAGTYDKAGRLAAETGRPGIDKSYTYDKLGRITEVREGGTVSERYSYGTKGREVTFYDGNGKAYTYRKDAFGRTESETNRLNTNQGYAYNAEGKLQVKTDFNGVQTRSDYDAATRTHTTTYADGSGKTITYNASAQITAVSAQTGTIRYEYDKGGLLIRQTDEKAQEITTYHYDKAGRRIRLDSGNREVCYEYGKNGELLKVSDNKQRLYVTYTYDTLMRETSRTFGNGVIQQTQYDAIGRTTLITETDRKRTLLRAEGYLYDEKGRRSSSVSETGLVTTYKYDRQSRLQTVLYPYTTAQQHEDKTQLEYAGIPITTEGNPENYFLSTAEMNKLKTLCDHMGYGRGSMVTATQVVWKESYTYDKNGNRASKTTPWGTLSYQYDSENRLVQAGNTVYTYDKNGNLLQETGITHHKQYAYTAFNRIAASAAETEKEKTVTQYAYDGLGRRTLTKDEGGTMRTLYDGQRFDILRENPAFADGSFTSNFNTGIQGNYQQSVSTGDRYRYVGELTTNGTTDRYKTAATPQTAQTRYNGVKVTLYAKGQAVAVHREGNAKTQGGRSYLGTDILGSVRSSTTEYGTLEDRYEYDAFGKPYTGNFDNGIGNGYLGKPYDTTTGLYNYGYRDYAPTVARFTTVDPIRDGNNWFAYVRNDPVNYVDLWGLESKDVKEQSQSWFGAVNDWAGKKDGDKLTDKEKTVQAVVGGIEMALGLVGVFTNPYTITPGLGLMGDGAHVIGGTAKGEKVSPGSLLPDLLSPVVTTDTTIPVVQPFI